MKRLNKKGFTLVELLAVIIILAVVVGITIPAVLSTVSGAKSSAFETASKTAADWFDRQYQAYLVGNETISPVHTEFKNVVGNIGSNGSTTTSINANAALISAAGLTPANIASMTVTFKDGRSCVVLTPNASGDYGDAHTSSTAGGGCATDALGLK